MLDAAADKTREELQIQCKIEMRYPFTMNEQYLIEAHNTKFNEMLKILGLAPDPTILEQFLEQVRNKFTELDIKGDFVKEFSHKLLPGKHAKAFDVISGALAYFQIASQRMIDFVPMRIEQHLIYDFSKSVEKLDEVLELVGEGGEKKCAELVKEDPKIADERASLQGRKEILAKASEILSSI
jgi:hypothetical protein